MTDKNSKFPKILKVASSFENFHLEADRSSRGFSLNIAGLVGVSSFSENEILLKSHTCRVKVEGRMLEIKVYESGTAEICGKVESIGFLYGKN